LSTFRFFTDFWGNFPHWWPMHDLLSELLLHRDKKASHCDS
jgi:hypothetical protein